MSILRALRSLVNNFQDVVKECRKRYDVYTCLGLAACSGLWAKPNELNYIKATLFPILQMELFIEPADAGCPPNIYVGQNLEGIYMSGVPITQYEPTLPQNICLILSQTCANRCNYCFYPKDEPPTPEKQIEEAIEYVASIPSIREVTFSGGEPLLYPSLQKHIDTLRKASKRVKVLTSRWPDKWTNRLEADEIRYHLLHQYQNNTWISPDGNIHSEHYLVEMLDKGVHLAGVATPETVFGLTLLDLLSSFSPHLTIYIQNDRAGHFMIPQTVRECLPQRHFTKELASYINNTLYAKHINYHIGKDEVYYSSDDRQKVNL